MKLGQSGLGIVQVLIATAMLGALSLGVMQVSKNMTDVNRYANSSLDLLMLKEEIYSIINDPNECSFSINNGPQFKRTEIDDEETEGRNLELYLSSYDPTQKKRVKGAKRFSATDEKLSKYGNIKIKKIKMVLDPTNPAGGEYSEGTLTDTGRVIVEFEKAEGKVLKFEIPTKLEVLTDSANQSKFTRCVGLNESQSANEKLLVVHSQSSSAPVDCPPGWIKEREGRSFVLASTDPGVISSQDLSDPGSCLEKFGSTVHIECKNNKTCEYASGSDFTSWLMGDSETEASKCAVCSKVNGVVKVLHSQTVSWPPCPQGTISFYNGYSLMALAIDKHFASSMRLDGPGSCLRYPMEGRPHIECEKNNPCKLGTGFDFAMFLTTRIGTNKTNNGEPFNESLISRCAVCLGVD